MKVEKLDAECGWPRLSCGEVHEDRVEILAPIKIPIISGQQ